MMNDMEKTKLALIQELEGARQRIADLEALEIECEQLSQKLDFRNQLLNAAGQSIIVTDMDGTIVFWNRFAEVLYGWESTEVIGQNIVEVTPTDATREQAEDIMSKLAKGDFWSGEFRVRRKNGTVFSAQVYDTPVQDQDGALIGIIGISTDLTERKNEEEVRLRESEELHRITLSNISDTVFTTDDTGKFTFICPNIDFIFGFSEEEIRAMGNINQLLGDNLFVLEELTAQGEITNIEREVKNKAGQSRFVLVNVKTVSIQGGTVLYTCRDITERKQSELALRKSEERFRLLYEKTPQGYQSLDENGKIIEVNPAWLELMGYERDEVIGYSFGHFLIPEHRKLFRERFPKFKDRGETVVEFQMLRKDKSTIDVLIEGKIGYDSDMQFQQTHCVLTNITERKRNEERILESEVSLKKAQRVAHVGSWTWHIKTDTLEWSDEMYHIFGIEKEGFTGFLGDVIERAIHPDDRARVEASNLSVRRTGTPIPVEYRIIRPDGAIRAVWAEAGELVTDEDDNPLVLTGIVQDISERKRAENALENELAINTSLAMLYKPLISPNSSINGIAKIVLEQARLLTGSDHGYVSEVDQVTGDNIGHTLTEMLEGMCQVNEEEQRIVFSVGENGLYGGLWGHSLNTKEPFFDNSPSDHFKAIGIPDGHIPLEQFLSVPVLLGDEVVGQIALANPGRDYTANDIEAIQRLGEFYALAIQRTRADDLIRESMFRLRQAEHMAHIGNYNIDIASGQTNWSDEIFAIFGLALEVGEPTVESYSHLIHEEDREMLYNLFEKCVETGDTFNLVYRIIRPNGDVRNVHSIGRLDKGADKQLKMFGTLQDISERKRAEEALRQSEERYRQLFNSGNDAVFVYHLSPGKNPSSFIEVNDLACQRLGYAREEILGLSFSDIGEALPKSILDRSLAGLISEKHLLVETVHVARDGTRIPVEVSSHLFELTGEPTVISIARDITERKRLEEEARKSETLQIQLEKERELIALKDRFISIVSHEFRTPLSVIQSSSDLLDRYFDKMTVERRQQSFQQIRQQISKLTEMIDGVLSITRTQTGKTDFTPTLIAFEPFCHTVFEQIQFTDPGGHLFEFTSNVSEQIMMVDGNLLSHILTNLLTNAVKYSPSGSRIAFALGYDDDNNHVVIKISDEGIGIPKEDQVRLFEPFHRARNVGNVEGTGLGLSIVKEYLDLHGGSIEVNSEVGEGSTFTIMLPIKPADS